MSMNLRIGEFTVMGDSQGFPMWVRVLCGEGNRGVTLTMSWQEAKLLGEALVLAAEESGAAQRAVEKSQRERSG